MIASYPSGKSAILFHGNVHKDVARCVGHGESEGPDGDSDSGALPQPNIGLQATANSLRSFLAPAIGGA
jgi:hypothetical protein